VQELRAVARRDGDAARERAFKCFEEVLAIFMQKKTNVRPHSESLNGHDEALKSRRLFLPLVVSSSCERTRPGSRADRENDPCAWSVSPILALDGEKRQLPVKESLSACA
jgi:hypothetical protein